MGSRFSPQDLFVAPSAVHVGPTLQVIKKLIDVLR